MVRISKLVDFSINDKANINHKHNASDISGLNVSGGFKGIDTNNLLFSTDTAATYIATEDCFIISRINRTDVSIYIDDINLDFLFRYTNGGSTVVIPLKKGQKATLPSVNSRIYGVL